MSDDLQADVQAPQLETAAVRVVRTLTELDPLFEALLVEHSAIKPPPPPQRNVVFVGFRDPWKPLGPEGLQLQGRLLRELRDLEPLVTVLVDEAPAQTRERVSEALGVLHAAADQSQGTYATATDAVLADVRQSSTEVVAAVQALYDPEPGATIYVVDANAALWNPALEDWAFGEQRFTLALTSTLLSELDELKLRGNESVRTKAESLVRRIGEYRSRGNIHAGVTLRGERSAVQMYAREPDFQRTLPWLDASVKDDRLVAQTIEIMRAHPHSAVAIVTRDGNLQNKADLARIPTVEPPGPPPERATPRPRPPAPAVVILEIRAMGGSPGIVTFVADVQSRAPHQLRLEFRGRVDDIEVACRPAMQDVVVNQMPMQVYVDVPRPEVGDLISAFGNENAMTLYNRTLTLEVLVDGEPVATRPWREHNYTEEENSVRYAIQQRAWRIGRGEASPEDGRERGIEEMLQRRREKGEDDDGSSDWVEL